MARKTKEEAQETRRHIMHTALAQFCQRGLAQTRLSDIAQAAGVTRGAIYWHFANKEQLFTELWEELCTPLAAQLRACVQEQESDPLGRLREFLDAVLSNIVSEPVLHDMFRLLFSADVQESDNQDIRAYMSQHSAGFFNDLRAVLEHAKACGQLPAELDAARYATFMHCTIDGYIINWLNFPERVCLARDRSFILETLFAALPVPPCCDV
ncbi:TetR family transcriptional regulator [Plesiomonas shigelloides]|uniref:TetR family transcriptional regulator n=1 Tax=Plesiomonas shigelloides TaxID=703 RepID=UPI0032606FDA